MLRPFALAVCDMKDHRVRAAIPTELCHPWMCTQLAKPFFELRTYTQSHEAWT